MNCHVIEPVASDARTEDAISACRELTGPEKLVLREIAGRERQPKAEVSISDDLLALLTGVPGPEVRGAVWNLVSKGYISRRGSFCLKHGTKSAYRILRMPRRPGSRAVEPARHLDQP